MAATRATRARILRIPTREEEDCMSEEEKMPDEEIGAVPEELPEAEEVPEPVAMPTHAWPAEDATENDRLMAALAYASQVVVPLIVPAVMLLAEESKARPFQRFHAIQSLGFLVAEVIYETLAAIVYCGLSAVTGGCLACVLWLIFLLPAIPALYYAYRAYQGLYFEIPLLTDFLVQNKWLEMPPRV
jgi:uncharacterized membrane protein